MRILSQEEINHAENGVIKRRWLQRQARHNYTLTRTLERCNEIKEEAQQELEQTRQQAKYAGYADGFTLFFNDVCEFITHYEALQSARTDQLYQRLSEAIHSSLRTPSVATTILEQLLAACRSDEEPVILLPEGMAPPAAAQALNIRFVHHDDFGVQDGMRTIQFPAGKLSGDWLNTARQEESHWQTESNALTQTLLTTIIDKLTQRQQAITSSEEKDDEYDEFD